MRLDDAVAWVAELDQDDIETSPLAHRRSGLKAKDVRGHEMRVMIDENYLNGHEISNQWQEAKIDLSHFGDVRFGSFDNFSLFTNGRLTGTRPQTIYVGGFKLQKGD